MSSWVVKEELKLLKLHNPVMIEGLPGIGNVGKIAIDFMIDALKAKKLCEFQSNTLPHSVFVNDANLVELPHIEMYVKTFNGKRSDLLLLSGDVQPSDEVSCYEFSEAVLNFALKVGCQEILTLGGIGLRDVPKKPRVFCTSTDKIILKRIAKETGANSKIYGVVGPIIGVSGVLVGLAERCKMPAAALLAETLGHPLYLGVKGAKELLLCLNSKLKLKLKINDLDAEIQSLEEEMIKRTQEMSIVQNKVSRSQLRGALGKEVNYIQ